MRRALNFLLGALAAGTSAAAQCGILAVVPLAGTIRTIDTPWAAGGRLWWIAALALLAGVLALAPRTRRLAALCGAGIFGFFLDLGISAWLWRVEKLTLLRDLGGEALEKQIRWESGILWLLLAPIFVLAFTFVTAYHRPARLAPKVT